MMHQDTHLDVFGKCRIVFYQLESEKGMLLYEGIFLVAELSGFPKYLGRNFPFSDIVVETAENQHSLFIF